MTTVRVFHGTTESLALQIQSGGFEPLSDIPHLLAGLCDGHEIDAGELIQVLEAMGRWLFIQSERTDRVWFASTEPDAFGWAERAPEWRWEALWGIWMIRSGRSESLFSDGYVPWMDPEASSWAFSQIWHERPAVVVAEVDETALISSGSNEVSVQAPFEHVRIREVIVGERKVEFTDAAGLIGINMDELAGRIHSGSVPKPRPMSGLGSDAWWPLSEFAEWSGLAPSGR